MGAEVRLAGRRLHFDGREWTVLYTDAAARMTLLTAGLNLVLRALRTGLIILQTDPQAIAAQPGPVEREKAVHEWLVLDATIAGAWVHDTLPGYALDLLERRLTVRTEYLSRSCERRTPSASTGLRRSVPSAAVS